MLIFGFFAMLANVARSQSLDSFLAPIDEENLAVAAAHTSRRIAEANLTEPNPSILVIDFFRSSPGISSMLGTLLADRFSASLAANAKAFSVLDRNVLKDYLTKRWTTLEDLKTREACLALGRQLGATRVAIGSIYLENGQIAMRIHLTGFGPTNRDEDVFQDSDELARIQAIEQVRELLFQSGPNYLRGPSDIPQESGVFRAGAEGVSLPACIYCPDPQYSNAARDGKIQGALHLSVVVTEEGKAGSIYVLKAAPLGLTAQAIKAVQEWRFRPAQKDGKPVPARVPIEFTFRMF